MYCRNCHSRYIIKVVANIDTYATGRLCKTEAKITEIVSKQISMNSSGIVFECGECGNQFKYPEKDIVFECTECYSNALARDIGFVESKDSPICKGCYAENFSDEEFTPILEQLDKIRTIF